ncbi:MAG: hypothetical protein JXA57_09820 [Armatimonadetes bacterium]|nr:hypothetical protein [Armatimonadota bacterium]
MKRHILARGLLAVVLALVLILAIAPVAMAAEDAGTAVPIEAQQLWGLLVSVAVPFVTGLLVRKGYAKWLKALISFVLAAAVGVVTTYVTGNWGGGAWVIVLACYGAAQTTFWLVVDRVPGLKEWLYSHLNTGG